MAAWIEQSYHLICLSIEARNIGAFVAVAMWTSQRQVGFRAFAAMLLGTDVVNLKWQRK
jgi:hypothetical protein